MRKTLAATIATLALALTLSIMPAMSATADPLPTCTADAWPVETLPPCNLPPEDANCLSYVYTYGTAIIFEHNQYLGAENDWRRAFARAERRLHVMKHQARTIRHLRSQIRRLEEASRG